MKEYVDVAIPKELYNDVSLSCDDPEKFCIDAVIKLINACSVD
jgi:hypothetical protein